MPRPTFSYLSLIAANALLLATACADAKDQGQAQTSDSDDHTSSTFASNSTNTSDDLQSSSDTDHSLSVSDVPSDSNSATTDTLTSSTATTSASDSSASDSGTSTDVSSDSSSPDLGSGSDSTTDSNLSPALQNFGYAIGKQIRPNCYNGCARDIDPSTPALDPSCEIVQLRPGEPATMVQECQKDAAGNYLFESDGRHSLPAGVDVCYGIRWDRDRLTTTHRDDLDKRCYPGNLQFTIQRRRGSVAEPDTKTRAVCMPSEHPETDCAAK